VSEYKNYDYYYCYYYYCYVTYHTGLQ
jgi:hypothetical protein